MLISNSKCVEIEIYTILCVLFWVAVVGTEFKEVGV